MAKRLNSAYRAKMREIHARYVAEREKSGQAVQPASLDDVYVFAVQRRMWEPPRVDDRSRFHRDMGQALREDYFRDERGRSVRRYHSAKYVDVDERGKKVQKVFWADILRTPPREHMEIAFKQRRLQIVNDCCQLKNDTDYYNEHNPDDPPIQLIFDFTDDLAELEQPDEYSPDDPEDDEN